MLADDITSPGSLSPDDLWRRYFDAVRAAANTAGPDRLREETDLDEATIDALLDDDIDRLTLSDAAAILAIEDGDDPTRQLEAVRDRLLFDMSTAILDVDALAADLALDLDSQEIQRRVEGREPMTLEEYAHIRLRIARGLR